MLVSRSQFVVECIASLLFGLYVLREPLDRFLRAHELAGGAAREHACRFALVTRAAVEHGKRDEAAQRDAGKGQQPIDNADHSSHAPSPTVIAA